MIQKTRKREEGVTLIELMIVLVIAGILVGGVYTLFSTQQRSYSVQDQVTGVQQDARAALTIMARDIRMAGSLIGRDGFSVNTFTSALTPTSGGSGGIDSITVVYAAEEFLSSTGAPVTVAVIDSATGLVTLTADEGTFDASDDDLFDTDKKKYVAFGGDDTVYVIDSVDTASLDLAQSPPAYLANVGARVFLVKAITYSVTTADGVLRRNENTDAGAQPLAGDGVTTVVEDLQFAYQVQGDTTWYNTPAEAGASSAAIRMVRINITVRTKVGDAVVEDADPAAQFNQPALEDHTAGLNGPDGFRRRVYTTVVKARNL